MRPVHYAAKNGFSQSTAFPILWTFIWEYIVIYFSYRSIEDSIRGENLPLLALNIAKFLIRDCFVWDPNAGLPKYLTVRYLDVEDKSVRWFFLSSEELLTIRK